MNNWIFDLPSPYLELAQKNYNRAPYEGTFIWRETEEGLEFWRDVWLAAALKREFPKLGDKSPKTPEN